MTYNGWYAIKPNKPNQTKPKTGFRRILSIITCLVLKKKTYAHCMVYHFLDKFSMFNPHVHETANLAQRIPLIR